jgi:hypothetical protein
MKGQPKWTARLWRGSSPSEGTKRNRRMRGYGTWGTEATKLARVKRRELRRLRGRGTWGTETKNLYRHERRRQRQERRSHSLLYKLLG